MAQFEAWAHLEVRYANFVELEAAGALWYPPIFLLPFFFLSLSIKNGRVYFQARSCYLLCLRFFFFFLCIKRLDTKYLNHRKKFQRDLVFFILFVFFVFSSKFKGQNKGAGMRGWMNELNECIVESVIVDDWITG